MTDKGAGYMQQALLDQLRKITEEERKILDGEAEVDKDLYTSGRDFTVDSRKTVSYTHLGCFLRVQGFSTVGTKLLPVKRLGLQHCIPYFFGMKGLFDIINSF